MNIAYRFFRSCFSVTLILFVFATFVSAQEETNTQRPWRNGTPFSIEGKEFVKALKDYPAKEKSDLEYLLVDYRIEFFDDGRVQKKSHVIYKILSRNGVQYSGIDRSWSPWFEKKPVIDARVISRRGFVSKLDQSTLAEAAVDELDDLVLSTDKRIQAPLPSASVGSIVETLTTNEQNQPFCEHGFQYSVYGASTYGVDCWRLTVVAPKDMKLTFNQVGVELAPEIKKKDGKTTWTFLQTEVDINSDLFGYLPNDEANFPQIQVSSGSSWQDFASYYSKIVQEQLTNSKLKNPITADLSEASNEQKVEHALEILHDRVRYTGLHFGSKAIVPKTPETTWKNGFGDCKDKSVLLVELLRSLDINAQVALLKSGQQLDVSPEVPAFNVFDHVIVYLPDLDLWIDPTAEWMPLGSLPQSDQNRWALIVDPTTSKLIKTPLLESSANFLEVDWTINLLEGEPALLKRSVKSGGGIGASYRDRYSSESKSRIKEDWFERLKKSHEAKKLIEFDFSDPYDFTVPFSLQTSFEGSVAAAVEEDQAEYLLDPSAVLSRIPFSFFSPQEESPEDPAPRRTSDFHMTNRHRVKICYSITGPLGFQLEQIPKSQQAKVRDIIFKVDFEKVSPCCCNATFEFDSGKGCLLYTSPSPRDQRGSRMPSSA